MKTSTEIRRARHIRLTFAALFLAGSGLVWEQAPPKQRITGAADAPQSVPPKAPIRPVTDDYFGTKVVDNYRYFENLKDPEVQQWIKAQADYTRATLDALPGYAALLKRVAELDESQPAHVSTLQIIAGRYYTLRRPPGAQSAKLFLREGIKGEDHLLIDPEKLSADQRSHLTIEGYAPSPDGRYVAYALAAGGSELSTLHILDVQAGKDLPETADRVQDDPVWRADSRSFFYPRAQKLTADKPPAERWNNPRVYVHVLGRAFDDDPPIVGRGVSDAAISLAPTEIPRVITVPGSRFAIAFVFAGTDTRLRVYAAPIDSVRDGHTAWRPVAASYDDQYIGSDTAEIASIALTGDTLYWISRKEAPRGRILKLDLTSRNSKPEIVVPQGELPIAEVYATRDAIYWRVSDAGVNGVRRLRLQHGARIDSLHLPYAANVTDVSTDAESDATVLSATSSLRSPSYLGVDAKTGAISDTELQPAGRADHPDDLVDEEVKVKSWDGTEVPLSIIHMKTLKLEGNNPTAMFGYGAYGVNASPPFSRAMRAWYERDGVTATCHVRGGGEYGEAWHQAGFQATKPNTWKDFIACAEYLIVRRYTSAPHLSAVGGSAGGIMIGRAIEERPDLFAAVVARSPNGDMLRFETTPSGPHNVREFGTVKTESGFKALYAMSPYANVKDGVRYPAVLITIGINDQRVPAWISAKFAARLQAATASGKPVLLRVDYDTGHGLIDMTRRQRELALVDDLAFWLWQTGDPAFQPEAPKQETTRPADLPQSVPPMVPIRPVTDDYFGTKVVDNYRYFENLKDPEVQQWMKVQADYTRSVLDGLPGRAALLARIDELMRVQPARVSDVQIVAGHYYSLRIPLSGQTAGLYVRDGLNGTDRLLIDPQERADSRGTHSSISFYAPSPDDRYVVYGLSAGGSENAVLHVFDIAAGKDTGESIDRARFAHPSWRDSRSFYYTRLQKMTADMPTAAAYQESRSYLHIVGDDPESDHAVLGFGVNAGVLFQPEEIPTVYSAPGTNCAVAVIRRGVEPARRVYVAPLVEATGPGAHWKPLAGSYEDGIVAWMDRSAGALPAHGDTLYMISRRNSPNGEVVSFDLRGSANTEAKIVLAAGKLPIQAIQTAKDALYVKFVDGGAGRLERVSYMYPDVHPSVTLPFPASVFQVSTDPTAGGAVFRVGSWTRPMTYLHVEQNAERASDAGLMPASPQDGADDMEVREVKVKSWDGAEIPLSIRYKKGLVLDGSHPTQLLGYGAYGYPAAPVNIPGARAAVERGVIFADAHVRGGGDYGEAWHLAGYKLTKPNTWRDFIACAEYLIAQHYTSPSKLFGIGESAGGILIGRAIEERPDLFAAVIDEVPIADTLRFETTAGGEGNVTEFGSTKTEEGFEDLYAMSSYAHVRDGAKYPAVMVTTAINDKRVEPWIPAKLAARLQAAAASGRAVLLRVDYDAGHVGIGATASQQGEQLADIISFALWQTGDPDFQPKTRKQ